MKDVLSKLPASTTDYICNEDNHKFTLTFWKVRAQNDNTLCDQLNN